MSNEMCDFVKLVLDRMDTFPEEFIEGDPKHRWGTLVRGLVDWAMEETETNAARSLWALEPHEREALTTKYKALYLESQKRAFLKNILGGIETQSKKVQVVRKGNSLLTPADITAQALAVLEKEWKAVDSNHITDSGAYQYGWRDPRGTNDNTNNT
jgi:hypothetical protein